MTQNERKNKVKKLQERRKELEIRFDSGEINEVICFHLSEIDKKIFNLLKSK